MYVCMYVCMYIYIYMYVYTHASPLSCSCFEQSDVLFQGVMNFEHSSLSELAPFSRKH